MMNMSSGSCCALVASPAQPPSGSTPPVAELPFEAVPASKPTSSPPLPDAVDMLETPAPEPPSPPVKRFCPRLAEHAAPIAEVRSPSAQSGQRREARLERDIATTSIKKEERPRRA